MAKTTVIMVSGKEEKEFDLQHAQRILDSQKKSRITTGWQLKEKSGYEIKDGTITPTDKGASKEPAK
jgi:hypothetical protein